MNMNELADWKSDDDYCKYTVEKVQKCDDGWRLNFNGAMSCYAPVAPDGYEPRVGSIIFLYFVQKSLVIGIVIDGHPFKYQTKHQYYAALSADNETQSAIVQKEILERDIEIAKLPEVFQRRIKKFQRAPDFRERLEEYELFACHKAIIFANYFKTAETLTDWVDLSYAEKIKVLPDIKDDSFFSTTLDLICNLALVYLEKPEEIPNFRGALSLLVGDEAYLPAEESD